MYLDYWYAGIAHFSRSAGEVAAHGAAGEGAGAVDVSLFPGPVRAI